MSLELVLTPQWGFLRAICGEFPAITTRVFGDGRTRCSQCTVASRNRELCYMDCVRNARFVVMEHAVVFGAASLT